MKLKKINRFIDKVKSFKPTRKMKDDKIWDEMQESKCLFMEFEESFEEMVREYNLKKKIEDKKVKFATKEKKKGWQRFVGMTKRLF